MVALLLIIMFACLLVGLPMFVGMLAAPLTLMKVYYPNIDISIIIQQLITGISTYVLLAVPMFIFAAEIMSAGQAGRRLLNLTQSFIGHINGGLAITAAGTCALFGAISGSAQATFVAIGRPMHKEMKTIGYSDSHSLGLLMSSANIAWLIPPSICMIMFAVVTGVSVAELFMGGIAPGILMFLVFSAYEYIVAKRRKFNQIPKATWRERGLAIKQATLPLGLPVLVLGGIYSGMFSPTEAAAASVLYAIILELGIYKSIKLVDVYKIALSTGVITATVFILIAVGNAFSWIITYANVPQTLLSSIFQTNPSQWSMMLIICAFFFICCMFVDSIPVILILTPIFFPVTTSLGIDPIHLGLIVTIQASIGAITPPFGCNIFTAIAIFGNKYIDVVRGVIPYIILCILITLFLIAFPDVALLSRNIFY